MRPRKRWWNVRRATRDESFITLDIALTRALIFRNFRLPETRLAVVGTVRYPRTMPLVKVSSLVIGRDTGEKKKDDESRPAFGGPETLIAMGLTSDKARTGVSIG